jgi:hypothetical protein
MDCLKTVQEDVSRWPQVTVYDHRFGGAEFRLGDAEVGHLHPGGVVDIPFPRSIRDALLARGLAEEHRWVPNSGWLTFRVRSEKDLRHALWLMRLSYVRYKLKDAAEPASFLARESEELHLAPEFSSLLLRLIPATANTAGSRANAGSGAI